MAQGMVRYAGLSGRLGLDRNGQSPKGDPHA